MLAYLESINPYIAAWAGLILAVGLIAGFYAGYQRLSAWRELRRGIRELSAIPSVPMSDRAHGLTLEWQDRILKALKGLPARSAGWWQPLAEGMERYTSPEGRDGYFVTRPVADLIGEDALVDLYYTRRGFHNVPGILTSLGLLGTFLALLFGLSELRVTPNNGVTGIENLISNLSGKFLTSVIALAVSVLFLLVDVYVCQSGIRRQRRQLVNLLAARLPYLTSSRVLLDIQRLNAKQAKSLSNISSEFIGAFKEVFQTDLAPVLAQGLSVSLASQLQTELGPTLERIDGTMKELTATVQRLEASKQESVVGELRSLTESLEASLRTTLAEMGAQFRDALSSSTKDEFGQLANVVEGSAGVLKSMTASFATMESMLRSIVDETRSSTSAQMTAGVEQTQRLNQLVEGLMTRLNEAASQNFDSVGSVLTTVVTRLSDRVSELSADLVQTVQSVTQRSQEAASATLTQAGEWSAQTGMQLTDLLSTLKAKSVDFERAGETLLSAQHALEGTLSQNASALTALGSASAEVRTYTSGLAGLQRQLDDSQKANLSVATLAHEAVAQIGQTAEHQGTILMQYSAAIEQYQRVFTGLDAELDRTLSTILTKMDAYTRGVERSFEAVLKTANTHFPDIAATLHDGNEKLSEQFADLTDALETATQRLKSV